MNIRSLIAIVLMAAAVSCQGPKGPQQYSFTPEEIMSDWDRLSGINSPYPDTAAVQTPAPRGYKPFYINRMTRHGSRYLGSIKSYDNFRKILEDADSCGVLTDTGKVILAKLIPVSDDAKDRTGMLQELGREEHRHMIDRLVDAYPEIFKKPEGDSVKVEAISTAVPRAIESLQAGTARLQEIVPNLDLTAFPGDSAIHFSTAHHSKYKVYGKISKHHQVNVDNTRIKNMLFTDCSFLSPESDSLLIFNFWTAAIGCRLSSHIGSDLFPYLEKEEIYPYWKRRNATTALTYGENSKSPLDYTMIFDRMRIQMAKAIEGTGDDLDLNYGHDANLMPLGRLLGLKPCCIPIPEGKEIYEGDSLYFWDFSVSPMGGNVTIVFYRRNPEDKDILVKVLLNEKEVQITEQEPVKGVYYKWKDIKPYWDARRDIASDQRDSVVVDDTRY